MTIELITAIGLGIILLLVAALFFIPAEQKKKKKKHRAEAEPADSAGDWEVKIQRLERHIQTLRQDVEQWQNKEKDAQKELLIERVKIKKLQEKLSQEREWREKEHGTVDKKSKEFNRLKQELVNVQESFSREHAANIQREGKIRDLEREMADLNGHRRAAESESARLNAQLEAQRKELVRLKSENAQLSKKQEDINWIAKTEYDRVAGLLKEAEKKLERENRKNS